MTRDEIFHRTPDVLGNTPVFTRTCAPVYGTMLPLVPSIVDALRHVKASKGLSVER